VLQRRSHPAAGGVDAHREARAVGRQLGEVDQQAALRRDGQPAAAAGVGLALGRQHQDVDGGLDRLGVGQHERRRLADRRPAAEQPGGGRRRGAVGPGHAAGRGSAPLERRDGDQPGGRTGTLDVGGLHGVGRAVDGGAEACRGGPRRVDGQARGLRRRPDDPTLDERRDVVLRPVGAGREADRDRGGEAVALAQVGADDGGALDGDRGRLGAGPAGGRRGRCRPP
jgi:hypothetical protein